MSKVLIGESILLAVLVVVAIFVRVGTTNPSNGAEAPSQNATEVMASQPLDTVPDTSHSSPSVLVPPQLPLLTKLDGVEDRSFAYDCTENRLVYANEDMNERIYPASLTKLLTALVVLEYMDKDTWITVGDERDLVAWDSSVAGLTEGDCLTVEKLIAGMLLPSGNDAAYTLAAATGRVIAKDAGLSAKKAVDAFMEEVNAYGLRMGLTGTHFTVPDGYHDPNHYTTAADMLKIAQACLENPLIMAYTSKVSETVTLQDGVEKEWHNSNRLVDPASDFYVQSAIGLKTGTTLAAGKCLLAAFRQGDRTVIVGVFGADERDQSFRQAIAIWIGVK